MLLHLSRKYSSLLEYKCPCEINKSGNTLIIYDSPNMGLIRLLLMLFLWKGVFCDDEDIHKYYTLTFPSPVTVQEGLCVLIPCQFTIEEGREAAESPRGYWFIKGDDWEGPAVASNDRTRPIRADTRGRFRLAGDVTQRNCSLRIDDVSTRDTRTYFFRYEHSYSRSSSIKYNYYIYPLRVTVVDLQDKPEISLRDPVIEGETVTVHCTAPGRCSGTAPKITWSPPESEFKYREKVYTTSNPDGTRTYTSTITFLAAMEHNNKRLYCTSYFPAVRKYTTSSVSLTVDCRQDTPEISLPDRVIEGETVTVRCTVRGRCSGTAPKITWSSESQVKYHEQVYGADNTDGTRTYTSAITFIATMEHNNKRLSCYANFPAVNKYTISSGSLTVDYNASQKLPLLLPIGGAVIGAVVLAGVCLLAWLISHKVRRTRDNNEGARNEKETVADSIPVYSVVMKTPKVPRAENNPCSGASTLDSKEDMFENFSKDNLQYATIHFSRANPGSKPSPFPEEALYSEVKVH